MQPSKLSFYPQSFTDQTSAPTFKIFTAYEDLPAFTEARKIQSQLEALCKDEMKIVSVSLHFSLFAHEQSWKHAIHEAGAADVIIISVSGVAELPSPIQRWIENWPRREHGGQSGLVLAFNPAHKDLRLQPLLIPYFKHAAEKSGMDFFCNREEIQTPEPVLQRQPETFEIPCNIIDYPAALTNWGIND